MYPVEVRVISCIHLTVCNLKKVHSQHLVSSCFLLCRHIKLSLVLIISHAYILEFLAHAYRELVIIYNKVYSLN